LLYLVLLGFAKVPIGEKGGDQAGRESRELNSARSAISVRVRDAVFVSGEQGRG